MVRVKFLTFLHHETELTIHVNLSIDIFDAACEENENGAMRKDYITESKLTAIVLYLSCKFCS